MQDPHADLEVVDLEVEPPPPPRQRGDRAAARAGAGRAGRAGDRVRPRRRWRGLVLGGLLLVLVLWCAAAVLSLRSVRDDLLAAREALQDAAAALGEGDLDAREAVVSARDVLAAAPGRLRSPVVWPATILPSVGRTVAGTALLAEAAADGTAAVARGLDALAADGGSLGALTPSDGRVPVEALAGLAPTAREVHADLLAALDDARAVPTGGVDPALVEARDGFIAELTPVADQAGGLSRVLDVLPGVLGADGPRRYLVVASNPTEPRGSGGFWGAYTVMTADDGRLAFTPVRPTQDLPVVERGRIPWPDPSLEERYDLYGGTGFVVNLNMTPDFPSAATALERFYEASAGQAVDGTVAVDPFAFEALLRVAGPVEVPGYGTVGPDEVVEFVSRGAYSAITDPEERKRLIGLVASAALQGVLDRPAGSPAAFATALGDMVRRESLLVHAADEEVQAALVDLGVSGRLGDGAEGDFLGVFLNSGASYKVDYWMQRRIRYDVALAPDGVAAALVSAGFTNAAPTSGEVDYMIGKAVPPLDVGDALSFVSVYCAPGCAIVEAPDAGYEDLVTEVGTELGFGVASTWSRLPAGRSRELVWTTTTPGAWELRGEELVYSLRYGHQPTIAPTRLEVVVAVPDGHEARGLPPGARVDGGRVVLELAVDADLALEYVFAPDGPA